jgi:PEP-CTERM motif
MRNLVRVRGIMAGVAVIASIALAASPAGAISFTFSDATGRSGSVDFTQSGADLTVTLTNTALGATANPTDVLTAVFFSLSGSPTLTGSSALVNSGSAVVNCTAANGCTAPLAGNVGGEWAYASGLAGAPGGAVSGISAVGFGLFGPSDRFDTGSNLQGPTSPAGVNFGLITTGSLNTANGDLDNSALIRTSAVFTLSGLPLDYDLASALSQVSLQYGSALDDPNLAATPEPGTLLLLGTTLTGLGFAVRRSRRQDG